MPHRYQETQAGLFASRVALGRALRESLAGGYRVRDLRADLYAGLVVAIVALPLALALAIAAGVPPQYGLYTSMIGGALVPLLGGSRTNVSGATAAFVVLLGPIAHRFGLGGLLLATMMSGAILVLLGLLRLGRLIQYIPYPVTTGFTAGVGVVIGFLQIGDFLGLAVGSLPEHFPERVVALLRALPSARWPEVAIGALTLAILIAWPRVTRRVPGPLIAMTIAGAVAWALSSLHSGFEVDTIGSRFSYVADGATRAGIPRLPPHFDWPWLFPGPDGAPIGLSLGLLRDLMGPAFAIAMLGAIATLLCAVVGDGIAGTKHDSNVELVAQGIGNVVAPFFGGIAGSGAVARTTTNIRSGARTPLAACAHALILLAIVLLLAPLIAWLPMASLAALLLIVAWNMLEVRHFVRLVRVAPKGDVLVLLVCFGLTVAFDMVIAVTVGIVLAALLFMRRMSELFEARLAEEPAAGRADPRMAGVVFYEIGGPLFFGAADKAASMLAQTTGKARAVILAMEAVPVIDISGLVALESAIGKLQREGAFVVLVGVRDQPRSMIEDSRLADPPGRLVFCDDEEQAVALVRERLEQVRSA